MTERTHTARTAAQWVLVGVAYLLSVAGALSIGLIILPLAVVGTAAASLAIATALLLHATRRDATAHAGTRQPGSPGDTPGRPVELSPRHRC